MHVSNVVSRLQDGNNTLYLVQAHQQGKSPNCVKNDHHQCDVIKKRILHIFFRCFLFHFSSHLPHFYDVIWIIFDTIWALSSTGCHSLLPVTGQSGH